MSIQCDTLPEVSFIDMQTEIQWTMRPYLLDFLIEAHASFQLLSETFHLAVNLLDRYCSRRVVFKRHYQLVGCAALLIAAKYGDRKDRVPSVKELRSMCCSVYEEQMFIQMEWHVLVTLEFTVGHPTVDAYLQILLSEEIPDPQVQHMTEFLCEMALYHRDFISLRPSTLSRSALALARCILSKEVNNAQYWSGWYHYEVFVELYRKAQDPSRVLAQKYATPQKSSVTQTLELFVMRQVQTSQNALPQPPQTPPVSGQQDDAVMSNVTSLPQTPQKGQPGPGGMLGYITPPITPDTQQIATMSSKHPLWHQQSLSSNLTPPSSVEHPRRPTHLHSRVQYPSSGNNMMDIF